MSSNIVLSGYDGALSGAEVEAFFSGNTYQGKHSVKGFDVDLYVNPDGTVVEKRSTFMYQPDNTQYTFHYLYEK